ncbi:GH25 family lysozyme [Roseburia sp. 831b]|uniref:GH25 family lysozyme n=1 Tax=Roseburia sp. 831b TaxID=1261635 RepID=UPI0009531293|nr:GH25 family lysozyme [Roseburia sp. 831b]WVK73815.1 GH25 family lysozyme [Roseburia sp. 831b]
MRKGIDVAKWQGAIDWLKVKAAGITFAILKVTNKSNQVEGAFEQNYAGASAAGLIIGVYRYVYAKTIEAAVAEANAIVAVLSGRKVPYRVWLDMEDASIRGVGREMLTQIIRAEANVLINAGYSVGIYCNKDWYDNVLNVAELQDFPFWIARYGSNNGQMPADEYSPVNLNGVKAWQYTSTGSVDGVNGNVDLDVSFEDLTVGGAAPDASDVPTYEVGKTYTLQVELKVRTGAGTKYPAKTRSQISADAKNHDADKDGAPDKGTVVTCKEVARVGNDIWIRTPSGWMAAYYQGNVYIK